MDLPSRVFRFCVRRAPHFGQAILAACIVGLSGCAQNNRLLESDSVGTAPRTGYRIYFVATRLKDHSPLASASTPLTLGQTATVRTSSTVATEDMPALPQFAATLTVKARGKFQVITKVSVREVARNKKGKLKRSQRFQGALLPIRLGEPQIASASGDPVQMEVRVDRP